MYTEKMSISLPKQLVSFVAEYQVEHDYHSRSEVIREALKLLQQKQLEHAYCEASKEVDPAFDSTSFDGLDDETW